MARHESADPERALLKPGTIVAAKLEVVRCVGEGGMGAVYEVVHRLTKHHRALKVLHPDAGAKPGVVERFFREASAAGRIGNAHIAETFDAGTLPEGEPFLVMELLEGRTLAARIAEGPIDAAELVDYALQACDGIEAAHRAGIIHRDLKPENLFITRRDGRPFLKILDFGVSKFQESDSTRALTRDGGLVGTPFYMAPEQLSARGSVDARSDVYSLGVILYECAAGARPFEADTLLRLAVLIQEGKPAPLATLRPDLPAPLLDTIARAMHPDPEARFTSARELAASLSSSLPAPAAPRPGTAAAEAPTLISDAPPARPQSSIEVDAPPAAAPSSALALSRSKFEGTRSPAWWLALPALLLALAGWLLVARSSKSGAAPSADESAHLATGLGPARSSTSATPPGAPSERASATATEPPPSSPVPIKAETKSAPGERHGSHAASAAPAPAPSAAATADREPVSAASRVKKRGLETNNPFR